jgi:hypothetical protein
VKVRVSTYIPWVGYFVAGMVCVVVSSCSSDPSPTTQPKVLLTKEQLLDPSSCAACHAEQYKQWSGSMHAYAADDPVFLAMNARGQRETNGALGNFCVQCHAPMAVRMGATTDGLNLADVPKSLKGVTCYFCHTVDAVEDTHNNPLRLADNGSLHGGISQPVENNAHLMKYSTLHDRNKQDSSALCGACHDVVTPKGVPLERTYIEWKDSIYSKSNIPGQGLTCGQCHMRGTEGKVAVGENVPTRLVHDHQMAGVDVALTDWPEKEAQKAAIQRDLDSLLALTLCVKPAAGGVSVDVTLDAVAPGHNFPSGAAHDRRAWVQVTAFKDGKEIYASGNVQSQQAATSLVDPDFWLLRDIATKEDGSDAHMFWDVATTQHSTLLGVQTNDPSDPRYTHSQTRQYRIFSGVPDQVTARVYMRPVGQEIIEDLVNTGDLNASFMTQMPTWELQGSSKTWKTENQFGCLPKQ